MLGECDLLFKCFILGFVSIFLIIGGKYANFESRDKVLIINELTNVMVVFVIQT